jgi:hypothetical protein
LVFVLLVAGIFVRRKIGTVESSDSSSPRKGPVHDFPKIGVFHITIADLGQDFVENRKLGV